MTRAEVDVWMGGFYTLPDAPWQKQLIEVYLHIFKGFLTYLQDMKEHQPPDRYDITSDPSNPPIATLA